jgi:hypothetical protein
MELVCSGESKSGAFDLVSTVLLKQALHERIASSKKKMH